MYKAFSLFSCSLVSIDKLLTIDENNKSSLLNYGKNQYVCPECYKPLFPKSLNSKFSKPHFSHYEKGVYDPECSIRKKNTSKNKLKDYVNKNKNIAKQIFQDIYIKSSILHIKKTIISYINQILGENNEDYYFAYNQKFHLIEFSQNNQENSNFDSVSLNIENEDFIYIFSRYSKLIFSFEDERSKFQNRELCSKIISPLLSDVRSNRDEIDDVMLGDAIDEIFLTISMTKGFDKLQACIVYAALILTFISYSRRSIDKKQTYNSVYLENILSNKPTNIKEAFLAFFATIQGIQKKSEIKDCDLEIVLKNSKFMTSIKERVIWFLSIMKFDDLNIFDIEKLESFSQIDPQSGYIYTAFSPDLKLIYGQKNVIKIGRSKDPFRREIQLSGQLLNNPVKITRIWKVVDQFKAESTIFDQLSNLRLKKSREIFLLSNEKCDSIISKILQEHNLLSN